jgi:hypothetical protein
MKHILVNIVFLVAQLTWLNLAGIFCLAYFLGKYVTSAFGAFFQTMMQQILCIALIDYHSCEYKAIAKTQC